MAPYQANMHRYQAVSWRRETTLILTIQRYKKIELISKLFRKKGTQKDTPSIWVPLHFLQSYNLTTLHDVLPLVLLYF